MVLLQSEKKPGQGAFGTVTQPELATPSPQAAELRPHVSSPRVGDIEVIDASISRSGTQKAPETTVPAGQPSQSPQAAELVDIVEVNAADSGISAEPVTNIINIAKRISEILKSKKHKSFSINDDRVQDYIDLLKGDKQNRITLATKLKEKGISAVKLMQIGFSFGEIMGAGFSDSSLLSPAQRIALSIKSFSSPRAQVLAKMYHDMRIPVSELIEYFNLWDLKAGGYTAKDFIDSGYPILKLIDPFLFSAKELRTLGLSADRLKGIYDDEEILRAGYTAKELKDVGYTAKQLREAKSEICMSVFTDADILEAGFDAVQLIEAGFSKKDLLKVGYTAEKFERANSIVQLKRKGYTAKKLKEEGFTIAELWTAGSNKRALIEAGYDLRKVVNLPPRVGQMMPRDI